MIQRSPENADSALNQRGMRFYRTPQHSGIVAVVLVVVGIVIATIICLFHTLFCGR